MNLFNDQNNAKSRKFAIYIIEVLSDLRTITDKVLDSNAIENYKLYLLKD